VTVSRGTTRLWRFIAVRPAASSGRDGSGIELRFLDYRGRRVLHRAHLPILNVRYTRDACGPYRDWQWQEGRIRSTGRDVAPGFRLSTTPAETIMQSGIDVGNFLGVGIYVHNQEVVLVSELEAGWYRYVSEWRLDANGTIRPRFGFAAVSSSCVCQKHHHHAYWRFDFDIGTSGRNRVLEFNDPAIAPGGAHWSPIRFETKRFRDAAHKRRWRVVNAAGKAYAILPGKNDRTARGDDGYAKGDLWVLRSRPGQLDDYPITGTEAQLDKLVNNESVLDQDVVVWYGAHFTHDLQHHTAVGHVVGPDLVPAVW
jgi:Cu2+-containing amine oxidase